MSESETHELSSRLEVTVQERPITIGGYVRRTVDAGEPKPIEGAVVRIEGTNLRAETDADGRFLIEGVRRGNYTIVAEAAGAPRGERHVQVPPDYDFIL